MHYRLSRNSTPHFPSSIAFNFGYSAFLGNTETLVFTGSLDTPMFRVMNKKTQLHIQLFVTSQFPMHMPFLNYFAVISQLQSMATVLVHNKLFSVKPHLGFWPSSHHCHIWEIALSHICIGHTNITDTSWKNAQHRSARAVVLQRWFNIHILDRPTYQQECRIHFHHFSHLNTLTYTDLPKSHTFDADLMPVLQKLTYHAKCDFTFLFVISPTNPLPLHTPSLSAVITLLGLALNLIIYC